MSDMCARGVALPFWETVKMTGAAVGSLLCLLLMSNVFDSFRSFLVAGKKPAESYFTYGAQAMRFNPVSNFPFISLNLSPMRCLRRPSCIIMGITQSHTLLLKVRCTVSPAPYKVITT